MRRVTGENRPVVIAETSRLLAEGLAFVLGEDHLQVCVRDLDEVVEELSRGNVDVLVIDGDRDGAEELVEAALAVNPGVRVVALVARRRQVRGAAVVSRHADVTALAALLSQGLADAAPQPVANGAPAGNPSRADGPVRSASPLERLTAREREVLARMLAGASGPETAAELTISPHTVRTHLQNILTKLGASSRHEAAAIAVRHGMRPQRSALPAGSS